MQQLVRYTKAQMDQYSEERQMAEIRRLHQQIHKGWAEVHTLQTQLTKLFMKSGKIQEATEQKKQQMVSFWGFVVKFSVPFIIVIVLDFT